MSRLVTALVPDGTLAGVDQPTLEHDGVVMRPWTTDDVDAVVRAYSDPAIQRWFVESGDAAQARAWIDRRRERWRAETGADWAVCDPSGLVLGRMGLIRLSLSDGLAGVAYWMLPEARGTGAARHALELMSRWALGDLGLHRLELWHSVDNLASCALATRGGYAHEGTARQRMRHADGWHDMHLHGRVAGD